MLLFHDHWEKSCTSFAPCPAAGSHELLRMVLEARADPDARDSFGQTPLMMAAKQADGSAGSAGSAGSTASCLHAACTLLEKAGLASWT